MKPKHKSKLYTLLLIVLSFGLIAAATIVFVKSKNSEVMAPTTTPLSEGEYYLTGDCPEKQDCKLSQIAPNGEKVAVENKYNIKADTQVLFSSDGNRLAYSSVEGIKLADLKTGTAVTVTDSKNAKLISSNRSGFWIEDLGVYKLYGLNSQMIRTIDRKSFPQLVKNSQLGLDLSAVYEGNKLLVMSFAKTEGDILRTTWEVSSENKLRKIADLNYNGPKGATYLQVSFFNNEMSFLVVTDKETYKLSSDNKKVALLNNKNPLGRLDQVFLSHNDSNLYYFKSNSNGQSDPAGLYKYSFSSKMSDALIKLPEMLPVGGERHSYQGFSESPSGKYLFAIDANAPGGSSTTYTPNIISLENLEVTEITDDSETINGSKRNFGWINYTNK
jgi:hypothetical protein